IAFRGAAEREIARAQRGAGCLSLLVIDVDQLRLLNAKLGHLRADRVIVSVAQTLDGHSRGYDVVGRFGGDEFVMLLPDADAYAASLIAERIRDAAADDE